MKNLGSIVIILLCYHFSIAQYQTETGARQGGMAGSGVVVSDIWSSYHNQAGLADLEGFSAGLFYSNMFNLPDLKDIGFALSFPSEKYGAVGLNYSYNGNEFSNFSKFGFAYAKRLGKRITAGIQLDYLRFAQLNYGNSGTAVGEIGFIAEPIENFYLGAHVFNPWRAKISGTDDYISSVFRIAGGYYFSQKVLLTVETEKDIDKSIVFRTGTEYNVTAGLFLRAGVALNPVKYSFGLGYKYKDIAVDIAYINHNTLGYYMQFGLAYTLYSKKEVVTEEESN